MADNQLQVTICGGGHLSHFSAALIGSQNIKVNIFTRKPAEWTDTITAETKDSTWESRGDIIGKINLITNDAQKACEGSQVFILGIPNNINKILLEQIAPYIPNNSYVGTCYAQGGFNMVANQVFGSGLKERNITIFGLFNVPATCRTTTYGSTVRVCGPKTKIYTAVMPQSEGDNICRILEQLYTIPTVTLPNFVNCILTPGNQIIHPSRGYGQFKDWDGVTPYEESKMPKLYADCDQFSADVMQEMDNEIQAVKAAIVTKYPMVNLDAVEPIKDRICRQYGDQVKDTSSLMRVFQTNQGYAFFSFPLMPVGNGVGLNINSRFFTEDIPYGLCILRDIGDLIGVKCPMSDRMIEWHQKFMNKEYLKDGRLNPELLQETGAPTSYGIKNIEQFLLSCGIEQNQLYSKP